MIFLVYDCNHLERPLVHYMKSINQIRNTSIACPGSFKDRLNSLGLGLNDAFDKFPVCFFGIDVTRFVAHISKTVTPKTDIYCHAQLEVSTYPICIVQR